MSRYFLFVFLMFGCLIATAQRNRSIITDCIAIMDIIEKNYDLIEDQTQRVDAIVQDRKRVVAIFKSYLLSRTALSSTDQTTFASNTASLLKARADLQVQKDELLRMDKTSETRGALFNGLLNQKLNAITMSRSTINDDEYSIFKLEIKALKGDFSSVTNPYLQDMLLVIEKKFDAIKTNTQDVYASGLSGTSVQKSISIFGGSALTFPMVAESFSTMIAKRLKEELANDLFQRIQTALATTQYDEFRILLPNTTSYLMNIQPEEYVTLPNTLREHVGHDVEHLVQNISMISSMPSVTGLFRANPELEFSLQGLSLIKQLENASSPVDVIQILDESALIRSWGSGSAMQQDINNGIKLSNLLLHSIAAEEAGQRTIVNPELWKAYAKNLSFYRLYLGFLLQQDSNYYNISFSGIALATRLVAFHSTFSSITVTSNLFGNSMESTLRKAKIASERITELKRLKRTGIPIGVDSIITAINSSLDLINEAGNLADDFWIAINSNSIPNSFRTTFGDFVEYGRTTVNIYSSIARKAYIDAIAQAVNTAISISGNTLNAQTSETITKLTEFLISCYKAKSTEEFAEAVEKLALPAGSSSIKRKAAFNLAINSYPGFFLTGEKLTNVTTTRSDTLWAFNTAFFAPVGLNAGWGSQNERVFSVFVSILDLGAFTSMRFEDHESELPETSFRNVFAPGVHFLVGLAETPLTFGIGAQRGPLLRKITETSNGMASEITRSSYRLGFSITYDIPLFNLYTRVR